MSQETLYKRLEKPLLELSRSQSIWTVFNDFLDFSLLFIRWWKNEAADYEALDKKYPHKHQAELMAEAYLAMGEIANHGGSGFKDPFGDFYEAHLSNARTGQFFTPEPVCDLIASMQIGTDVPENATINDPCCGSGRLLLAAAKINRKARFYAADVDPTCCKMTVLNFLINTMRGEVSWMNSLTQEHWKTWQIRSVLGSNGFYLPYYFESTGSRQRMSTTQDDQAPYENKNDSPPIIKSPIKTKTSKKKNQTPPNQLFLSFD
jgi:type I restriction-modification system DNA methylase subunit